MHNPGTDITCKATLLPYQQIVTEGCHGDAELAKFNRAWTDDSREQVPSTIEEINSATIYGPCGVEGCTHRDVIPNGGNCSAKLIERGRVWFLECLQQCARRPIEEIDDTCILNPGKIFPRSGNQDIIPETRYSVAEKVQSASGVRRRIWI